MGRHAPPGILGQGRQLVPVSLLPRPQAGQVSTSVRTSAKWNELACSSYSRVSTATLYVYLPDTPRKAVSPRFVRKTCLEKP